MVCHKQQEENRKVGPDAEQQFMRIFNDVKPAKLNLRYIKRKAKNGR